MVEDIEQRIYALARRYNGVYLMNNEAKQKLLNAKLIWILTCSLMSLKQKI